LYHAARQDAAPLKQRVLPSDLTAHLQRCGVVNARVEESSIETPRFTWPTTNRLVSIIIPSKDHVEYLQRCLESIWRVTQYPNYEIVIVDNDSLERRTLDYYTCLRQTPGVTVVECRDAFNYSAYNNRGAHQGRGDILLFLNNDVEVLDPDWLDELERWVERPEVGIVGAKLLYPDGIIQHAGIVLGMEGHASHVFGGLRDGCTGPFGSVNWYRDVLAVTGACMMVRREVFEALGGFDEQYVLVFGDIEICLRAVARGYRVVYTPFARLIHYEGKSRAHYIPATDIRLAYRHMKTWVERGDPYYNPNLSHAVRFPTLRRRGEAPLERLRKIVEYS
jgi:GT2 family glycosyltransferase